MEFRWHILFGFVISYILVKFIGLSLFAGLIIFLSSWMIDIDHYFWYAFETKKLNPKNAINWYIKSTAKWDKLSAKEKSEFKKGIYIFHYISFWIILIILTFFYNFAIWILAGVIIHISADWSNMILKGDSIYSKLSHIYTKKHNKYKRNLSEL